MDESIEAEIVKRFIVPSKRQRCIDFLSSPRRRSKFIDMLCQPSNFDARRTIKIEGGERATSATLVRKLLALGLGERVYVISSQPDWDGGLFELADIIVRCLGRGDDTVGYSTETGCAFYEWHHGEATYFLDGRQLNR